VSNGEKSAVLVTGISGNLGSRLLPLLESFNVIGVDIVPPRTDHPLRFEKIDLGREACCRQLVQILRESRAQAIVHLAFVVDPVRSNVLDSERMWQINVAGTARVMEAITEANRRGVLLDHFIFPSSTIVYGPETPGSVRESHPLAAETLPYALHKQEADNVVRMRHESLGSCATYLLRSATFTGATMENYLVGALRGTPTGTGKRAERMRQHGKRLPLLTPGKKYRENRWQFVHVDDVARLIAYILKRPADNQNALTVLNVAGRGEPITFEDVAALGNARVMQVPGKWAMREMLRLMWNRGVSAVPFEATPYLCGSCLADTSRLKQFLGSDYEKVIQYSVATALQDTFKSEPEAQTATAVKA
jgi:nucleoside-diphosphate-sugar epimerase